jgi:F420-dependent oxidoreductase-like protein
MLEGYTALGYLAAHTSKIDLSLLVTGVTYRHPGLLAKIVTTLDVLSGGRAVLGIGAAWFEREHRGLGVPFPPVAERFERLEETLRICGQMWDQENSGPFEGKHYQLAETLCSPQPINRPKVLIGGGGERKTLRLVAQYGDACNLFASSPNDVEHKLDVLRRHCDDVGRGYDEIRKTIIATNPRPSLDTREEFVRQMAGYAELGVQAVIVTPTTGSPAAWIEGMAPAVPQLAELG